MVQRLRATGLKTCAEAADLIVQQAEALEGAAVIVNASGAELRSLKQASNRPETVKAEYSPEPVRAYPEELTPALRRVLSMMLWETTPIAHALRASGRAIARKCEDEQAVVLHWLTGIVLEHGEDWQKHAAIELRKLTEAMG
ncbi:hypothetical protein SAMN05445504_2422 [Burkholderia sp. CF099]|nr:hypothetical protein SAMN05445504_2422 [Burkholderia sp. CF099]